MPARAFSCPDCGYVGPPEEIVPGLDVCPACGGRGAARESPPPFDKSIYRYGTRLFGIASLFADKLGARTVRDAADRPIARVSSRRMTPKRFVALSTGALVLGASLVLYAMLVGELPDGWLLARLVMLPGALFALGLSLAVVCLLSPGPDALLVAAGSDPRLLVRVRPVRDGWTKSTLAVEDGEGRALGSIVLDRFRNVFIPLGLLGPVASIDPARGPRVLVRRPSLLPGIVMARADDGDPIATFGCNAGLFTRDALEIVDEPPIDRRLLVAVMVLVRP
ncbi:MAG TPA: hypothetical protein VIL20_19435 [Sandaracinaceae bacterium]